MQVMSRLSNHPVIHRKGVLWYELSVSVLQFFGFSKNWRGEGGGEAECGGKEPCMPTWLEKLSVIVKRIAKAEQI